LNIWALNDRPAAISDLVAAAAAQQPEGRRMRYIEAVRAQGKNLRSSRAAVAGQLSSLDLAPWRDRRLGLIGMGASANAIAPALRSYWSAGLTAVPWLGSELSQAGAAAGVEAVIAVSQGGESAEIVTALRDRPGGCAALAVTDAPDSPVGRLVQAVLDLALLEDSNVRTIGYTGTVQGLLLLRDALAPGHAPAAAWDELADQVDELVPAAERLAGELLDTLRAAAAFDLVGSGVHAGTAAQGALLLREVAKQPAAAYETYQYLHGPVEAAGPGLVLVVTGGAREVTLAQSMADAGATVILVTAAPDAGPSRPGLTVFPLPAAGPAAQAILGILPAQAISGALADAAALPDGEFRYHQDDTKVR
jgi:glutamine---fructose-6-phosphate transaminase (isomerizing)